MPIAALLCQVISLGVGLPRPHPLGVSALPPPSRPFIAGTEIGLLLPLKCRTAYAILDARRLIGLSLQLAVSTPLPPTPRFTTRQFRTTTLMTYISHTVPPLVRRPLAVVSEMAALISSAIAFSLS